ncbi:hypothetical protein GCM10011571_07090 [Marinithermofilum abyssi]|uniref:Uncharacterized protein n=1 Tax=Marinithermofilum abyssi TaxID=1571185 RepID=A0A8J2VGC3_9BACL|nr:hypothetical protein [Marinithermofilum abyssi]GGE08381.1 hypothetical protein GCM10011571_07090 [Marinithermofilum abyssi]
MIADQFEVFIFDLDGVIYLGDDLLPGVKESITRLQQMGKIIRFLTNDPRPSRRQVARRLSNLGLDGSDNVNFGDRRFCVKSLIKNQADVRFDYWTLCPDLCGDLLGRGYRGNGERD